MTSFSVISPLSPLFPTSPVFPICFSSFPPTSFLCTFSSYHIVRGVACAWSIHVSSRMVKCFSGISPLFPTTPSHPRFFSRLFLRPHPQASFSRCLCLVFVCCSVAAFKPHLHYGRMIVYGLCLPFHGTPRSSFACCHFREVHSRDGGFCFSLVFFPLGFLFCLLFFSSPNLGNTLRK